MKKVIVIMGSLLIIGMVAATAFSWGPDFGRGRHMMSNWDRGPAYNERYGGPYGSLTEDQKAKMEELDKKFYDETIDTRDKIHVKSAELSGILNDKEPDIGKAKALMKEINDLRETIAEKGLDYQLAARKIVPDLGYGRGYGMGIGPHMFGGGPGMGSGRNMRDYGPRHCWN